MMCLQTKQLVFNMVYDVTSVCRVEPLDILEWIFGGECPACAEGEKRQMDCSYLIE